jgi:cytidine deaminase
MRAEDLAALREAAFAALGQAYAPYSNFRVGAALRAPDGTIYSGCNVENSAYPAGMCAERAAVCAAVSHGVRRFDHLLVVTEAEDPTPPCGICRQVLVEFAPSLSIVSLTRSGREASWTLAELLSHPFTPHALSRA